jgi:hypothetical protein
MLSFKQGDVVRLLSVGYSALNSNWDGATVGDIGYVVGDTSGGGSRVYRVLIPRLGRNVVCGGHRLERVDA